jgi:serine/threonine-protein kinase
LTALALGSVVHFVSERETRLLEQMAEASGGSIAAFVTANAAVTVVDNAGLPPKEQDWAALQAFVMTASHNTDVRQISIVDVDGTIRAASNPALVGTQYRKPADNAGASSGMRFVRPINYADALFGTVDLELDRTALDRSIATSRTLMIALAALMTAVVFAVGYLRGAMVARPLRRLRDALEVAATGDFSVRLAHRRRDEFGEAFDSFNRAAAEAEAHRTISADPSPLAATRIAA